MRMAPRPPARLYPAVFLVIAILVVGGLSFVVLRPFLAGMLWAAVLAVALWPLWERIRARSGRRTSLAAGLFCLSAGVIVLIPAGLLGLAIVNQATGAAAAAGAALRARDLRTFNDLLATPWVGRAMAWANETVGVSAEELQLRAAEAAAHASKWLATAGGAAVLTALDVLMTFVITLFLLFFFLRDGEAMVEGLSDLIPIPDAERRRILRTLGGMMESIFKGSLLCAIVQGASGGLSWAVAGLPSAVLAGAAMGVLSLLPIGGTAIVWAPGLVVLLVQGRTGAAIAFLAWNVVVTSTLADNVLKPLLIGKRDGELSTLLVFLGVFGGLASFGLLGVFVGPMALALGLMLVRILRELARASRASEAA